MKGTKMRASILNLVTTCVVLVVVIASGAPLDERQQPRPTARKPNIVFILGDDLGYCDVSMYGCRDIPTPNIDSIAVGGVKFTNGYVTAPVCSPSRAGLLTGRYQQRFGFEFNAGSLQRALADPEMGLPTSEITLAEMMKKAGYATGMVGKWHLGMHAKFHPTARGFDEYFGFLFGANMYIDPDQPGVKSADPEGAGVRIRGARNPIIRNQTPVEEKEYLTEAFAREAVAFIERHRNEPFFLYAPFNAPHTPLQATKKYIDRFPQVKDERRQIYMAMVSALDDAVGAILKKLRDANLERNTLVVFLSDNGCATYTRACTNDPLRLGKLTHFEGGFRVPFAMRLPGVIKAGAVYDAPISSLDLFPTAVALAGSRLPGDRAYDGVDLLPHLTGKKKTLPHEVLCWRNGENAGIRKGKWKLFRGGDHFWLFDLSKDTGEQTNVAEKHPDVVEQLKKELLNWEAGMKQPQWPCRKTGDAFPVVVDRVKLNLCI
ncbi:MAG TPA: sulfatase-like hydrolase/transferase [Blastocatellia bacterium]|nr:sulfatase-like hydrolase/transferase [Blastocatellia bacterium]